MADRGRPDRIDARCAMLRRGSGGPPRARPRRRRRAPPGWLRWLGSRAPRCPRTSPRGAPRQRLDAERARAGEQVQHPRVLDARRRGSRTAPRGPGPTSGACLEPAGRLQAAALVRPGDHAHPCGSMSDMDADALRSALPRVPRRGRGAYPFSARRSRFKVAGKIFAISALERSRWTSASSASPSWPSSCAATSRHHPRLPPQQAPLEHRRDRRHRCPTTSCATWSRTPTTSSSELPSRPA